MHKHVRRSRATVAKLAAGALAAAALTMIGPATATTTVTGGDPGTSPPVVRDSTVTVTADRGALMYYRTAKHASIGTTAYTAANLTTLKTLAFVGRLCRGDNPATGGVNLTPFTKISVTDPGGQPVASAISPVRDVGITGSGGPLATQPAPSNTNYRGDVAPGTGTSPGFSLSLNMAGRAPGTYTVTTVNSNMTKSDETTPTLLGACVVGTPSATNPAVIVPGAVTTTTTFIYRPWQYEFKDVFGNGSVQSNVIPRENKFKVGTATTPIYAGTPENTTFYALPDGTSFELPSDPAACAADPASCLPSAAVKCEPGPGCTPRVMIINEPAGKAPTTPNGLVGAFDLDSKAFIALAKVNGTQRILSSLGTDLDARYHDMLVKIAAQAAAHGANLNTILASKVTVNNGQYATSLSLLNALQIDPSNAHGGISISSDATAQAGLILDIYADILPNSCVTKPAVTNTSVPARFTPTVPYGYTVEKSDVLPNVPAAGPLGTIAGGPLFHITGKFRKQAEGAIIDTASAVLGADTAANEPNGYPVWLEPFIAAGATATPHTMDFLGTATWSASESNLLGNCLVVDFMLGTGVAVFNNPLPVGLGTLFGPLYKPSPAGEQLNSALNAAIQQATDPVTTNPTVAALLAQLLGALPV